MWPHSNILLLNFSSLYSALGEEKTFSKAQGKKSLDKLLYLIKVWSIKKDLVGRV